MTGLKHHSSNHRTPLGSSLSLHGTGVGPASCLQCEEVSHPSMNLPAQELQSQKTRSMRVLQFYLTVHLKLPNLAVYLGAGRKKS